MFKSAFAATALALSVSAPAQAAVDVTVNFGATNPVAASNDFATSLAGLGFTRVATLGASLILNGPALITFEFLGSESGFNDRFTTPGGLSYTETSSFQNNFAAPILIGPQIFSAGSLTGLLNFLSAGGAPATVGQDGFGIFLGPNQVSGSNFTTFYFGYDDQITNQDDDHDDFIIRATVSSPVPEPASWALAILGMGAVGWSLRRRQASIRSFV